MNSEEFNAALEKLDLNLVSQIERAAFFGITERQQRRWETGEGNIPRAIAMLLSLMIKYKIAPDRALTIAKIKDD